MEKNIIEPIKYDRLENIKPWVLKNRTYSLLVASLLGVVLAIAAYHCFDGLCTTVLHSSLTILALGLPTFFILWLFRTRDVQENINNSTFFECARMLVETTQQGGEGEKKSLSAKIALEQLAYLRKENSFNKEKIDLLTQGLNLTRLDLKHAYLGGLNLSRADLSNAHLEVADLSGTKLSGTDLSGAYLQGANLSNFIDDVKDKNKWNSATYNNETKFDGTWLAGKEARDKANMEAMSIKEAQNKNMPKVLFSSIYNAHHQIGKRI